VTSSDPQFWLGGGAGVDGPCKVARIFASLGGLLLLAMAGGCGDRRLDVAPVRGKVVYRGTGIPRAVVIFHPDEEAVEKARRMRPFAYTDEQGNFQLKTYVDGDGAPPGDYRVSIVARSTAPGNRPRQDARETEKATTGRAINIPAEVSKKYANVETSGIAVTVHEGENTLEPFVL
jgi:hypothetical protein